MTDSSVAPSGGGVPDRQPGWLKPGRSSSGASPDLPENLGYRIKRTLLGPPLVSEQLHGERLGKPVALAVLSSDVMSSSAYATESILRILIPAAGLGAFRLITPTTVLLLIVLAVVCSCYRDVVKTYPVSGGSYVVSRENFGYAAAQIPGAALLCSYTLTVAVSIAAGVNALSSAFSVLAPYQLELSVGFVLLLAYANLRGIREAGKIFALPTYWFLASMAVVIVAGLVREALNGGLGHVPVQSGHVPIAPEGSGLLLGASVFIFLRGFANGGSGLTGTEAISNAVSVFREPQVRNARQTLVLMATILGTLFLAVSVLAALTQALPYNSGSPTVLSQIGRQVFGAGTAANIPYYSLQFSTALILILGANTSFNGFPLLVSFIAQDAYLPKPLTTRGHRLVYSNGVLLLAVFSVALLLATDAKVASLIPLYAATVFTGFTMAGAGMFKYHLGHPSPDRRKGLIINGFSCACCAVITLIFLVTEFSRGAWLIVIVIPLIVLALSRTHRVYTDEREVLAEESQSTVYDAPTLSRHVVVVLVDRVDLATARALQLARSLALGNEIRAVHFVTDEERAERLSSTWNKLALGGVALELIEVPDRRLVRAATELADDLASDGQTEVLMVLPRRAYRGIATRILHDHTADRIVTSVTQITNVSATIAPFDVHRLLHRRRLGWAEGVAESEAAGLAAEGLGDRAATRGRPGDGAVADGVSTGAAGGGRPAGAGGGRPGEQGPLSAGGVTLSAGSGRLSPSSPSSPGAGEGGGDRADEPQNLVPWVSGTTPLGEVHHRQRVRIAGRVRSVRTRAWSGVPVYECTVVDGTGALVIVFLGRQSVAGIGPGTRLIAGGAIGTYQGRLAILNPAYELLAPPAAGRSSAAS
jgi:amino acid transporter